jgi:tetratricopeptide (TPR) repeat protein
MTHGRPNEAGRVLTASHDLPPDRILEYRAALAILPFRRTPAVELTSLREQLQRVPVQKFIGTGPSYYTKDGVFFLRHQYLLAMLALKAGDLTGAEQIGNQLAKEDIVSRHSPWLSAANLIRAEVLRARGQNKAALAVLAAPQQSETLPNILDYPWAHERFLRGELLSALGRNDEALRWYGTFPDPGAYDLMYLAPVHFAKGAAYERLGDRDGARASYLRGIALWQRADPEFAPLVAAAKSRLAALAPR